MTKEELLINTFYWADVASYITLASGVLSLLLILIVAVNTCMDFLVREFTDESALIYRVFYIFLLIISITIFVLTPSKTYFIHKYIMLRETPINLEDDIDKEYYKRLLKWSKVVNE